MTNTSINAIGVLVADTDHLPQPESMSEQAASNSALPRPVSTMPSIADNGRIRFGAGYRAPRK